VTSFFIWYKPVTACLLLRSSQFETWTRKVSIRLVHFTYLLPRLFLFAVPPSSSSSAGNCHFIPRKTGTISHHRFLRKVGFKLRRELNQYFLVDWGIRGVNLATVWCTDDEIAKAALVYIKQANFFRCRVVLAVYNSGCNVPRTSLADLSNVTCAPLFVGLILQADKIT
jgi:hypothetical protein